jgi:hypothetical protein
VALVVVEDDSSGIFQSAFGASLRALGDVQLVSSQEKPQFFLNVMVACEPLAQRCSGVQSFFVSVNLWEPLTLADFYLALARAGRSVGDSSSMQKAFAPLSDAGRYWWSGHALWGIARYEIGVRELVANFDTKCFEHRRRKLNRTPWPEDVAEIDGVRWIC